MNLYFATLLHKMKAIEGFCEYMSKIHLVPFVSCLKVIMCSQQSIPVGLSPIEGFEICDILSIIFIDENDNFYKILKKIERKEDRETKKGHDNKRNITKE